MSKEIMITGEELLKQAGAYLSEAEVVTIEQALTFATGAHEGQMRSSGQPYIIHPIQVAGILTHLKLDGTTIAAGLLHDVVEDTPATLEDLTTYFGAELAEIVDGVTKLGKIEYKSDEEQLAENHRKMLMAMSDDMRVIMVKLADRLHNMRTLKYLSREKQQRISKETMDIYAPLAHRLGISSIKWELEDLSFRYLNEVEFYKITHLMKETRRDRETLVQEIIKKLEACCAEANLPVEIYGRPKHIYSIYRKMRDKNKTFDQLYDLIAIRCLTPKENDTYTILGYIHDIWTPMPKRFKDYIGNAKPNGYQSIHTTVMGDKGPIEFQIRTPEMHAVAEYGVAAHWAYKKGVKTEVDEAESNVSMSWLNTLRQLQVDADNAQEFVTSVKEDLLTARIYVFAPDGSVRELPKDSTPIDFAYEIHTRVGERAVGARINGVMAPLHRKLRTGDQVEIITSNTSFGPSRDWLDYTKTHKARNRIRQFLRNKERESHIYEGREQIKALLQERGFIASKQMDRKHVSYVLDKTSYKSENALFAAVGAGELSALSVVNRLTEEERRAAERQRRREQEEELVKGGEVKQDNSEKLKIRHEGGVVIQGASGLLMRLAKCCHPVPGDGIVGYITKGRGVVIHRDDCMNVRSQENFEQRHIEVEWEDTHGTGSKEYEAEIVVYGLNRRGILHDTLKVLNNQDINIIKVNAQPTRDMKFVNIYLSLGILNLNDLRKMVDKVRNVPDVYSVKRMNG